MQAHRNGHTPPPLPRNPSRSMSTSTVSTVQTNYTQQSGLIPPSPIGGGSLASPVSLNSRQNSYGFGSAAGNGNGAGSDEIDKLGYMYSLRVAVLHHHMTHPPPPTMTHRASTASAFSLHSTPPLPPMPSPPLQGTSPNGSRLTFSSFSPPTTGSKTPEMGGTASFPSSGQTPSPGMSGRRKSSGFGLSLGRNKSDDGQSVKLPKEFLLEFWGILANEDGDSGWKTSVITFLGLTKKGTKTPSGLNLREVPTLLEAFTQSIPPNVPGSAPAHAHQSHLLQLLYNSLPRSSFFSPLAKPQTEKDRDFLFRLRAEVQSYMLSASPNPEQDSASSGLSMGMGMTNGPITPTSPPQSVRRKSSAIGLGRISTHSQDSVKRKPSPIWDGDVNEMVDTVGQVWGIKRDVLDRDVIDIKRSGVLEQMYMADLKRAMTVLSSQPPPLTQSQKNRQMHLSQAIAGLLKDFPDLATPGSPNDYNNAPLSPTSPRGSETSQTSFFIPPRSIEVFGKLASKSAELGHSTRTRDLLEKCRDIWGIASRREKEKELETIIGRWGETIGTGRQEEIQLSKNIAETVKLLSYGVRPSDPLSPILSELLSTLLSLINTSLLAIFPTTSSLPPAPPPSLLIIFNAAPALFEGQSHAQKVLENTSDELKGAAIGEYVQAVEYLTGGVGQQDDGLRKVGSSGKDKLIEGFENVAGWIYNEIINVKKVWGKGLGSSLNPAAIIISRQLPLFLAELQVIDKPRGVASDIFSLYETTGKLLDLWDDLCPNQEHGFELDSFFEPHVMAWLKDTEGSQVHDWVSRAVGMDSNKHSQSVIDLFEFIRSSAQVILHELPLTEHKRAVFLIDYSKTVSLAVSTYATTVLALFQHDINPAKVSTPTSEIQNKLGSKAGNWLAKGQQAVKSLEKKKVDGFAVPPAACVKMTDMSAAKQSLEDLMYAMEAEDTARIIKQANSVNKSLPDKTARHVFTVTILRGENLVGKGGSKPADSFIVVTDREDGSRLIKTRTLLGAEDPRWEQSFEISVGNIKVLELQAYDRQLVGKHELLGTSTFKLDSRAFNEQSTRDIVLPLSSTNRGGLVHLRISMEGGAKNDISYHLSTAARALDRSSLDMSRELIDRMSEYLRSQLSANNLNNLTKPLKDKKKAKSVLSEQDIESSLGGLFDYLNDNFSVFSVTLNGETKLRLMISIWRRIIDILISLLVPPLSDKPFHGTQLTSSEIDVVFKWLQLLKSFFNANESGIEHGVPLNQLQSGNYKDLIMLGQYLDLPTPTLKERASAAVKQASKPHSSPKTSNSTLSSGFRNLNLDNNEDIQIGRDENERMAEILLRIARTRPDIGDFLSHEIGSLNRGRVEKQGGIM
uniref:Cytoplasmic protein n=1 Tax=Kwoniella pini CBS 10737 TaxID=1296096 RepID=A0A1B9HYN4_9TREE|nr:cytoplasmic protein [Kwoniella pini CBS 10737]OCF48382.1 cytoplasmic protein [Kwoniella pini CBS 10737]